LVDKIFELFKKEPHYRILNKADYEIRHQYLASRKSREMGLASPINDTLYCMISLVNKKRGF